MNDRSKNFRNLYLRVNFWTSFWMRLNVTNSFLSIRILTTISTASNIFFKIVNFGGSTSKFLQSPKRCWYRLDVRLIGLEGPSSESFCGNSRVWFSSEDRLESPWNNFLGLSRPEFWIVFRRDTVALCFSSLDFNVVYCLLWRTSFLNCPRSSSCNHEERKM